MYAFVGKILFCSLIQSPLKKAAQEQQPEKTMQAGKKLRYFNGSGSSWKNVTQLFLHKGRRIILKFQPSLETIVRFSLWWVGGCLQKIIGASNIQRKGNGVEYVIGASFKGINKYKTLYVPMWKNKTPDCLFAPEFDAGLRLKFEFHSLSFLCPMSFKFLRSLSALPYTVNTGALSVGICMCTTI